MTGYQEILTDPSYRGQIVLMTYPLIGNTGVNDEDVESRRLFLGASSCVGVRSAEQLADEKDAGGVLEGMGDRRNPGSTRGPSRGGYATGAPWKGYLDRGSGPRIAGGARAGVLASWGATLSGRWRARVTNGGRWPATSSINTRPWSGRRFRVVAYDFGIKFRSFGTSPRPGAT
jgi:carbamoyl-phosphate synthase small subunit